MCCEQHHHPAYPDQERREKPARISQEDAQLFLMGWMTVLKFSLGFSSFELPPRYSIIMIDLERGIKEKKRISEKTKDIVISSEMKKDKGVSSAIVKKNEGRVSGLSMSVLYCTITPVHGWKRKRRKKKDGAQF